MSDRFKRDVYVPVFDLQLFSQEKTEEPTERKRKKERDEGRTAQSKDLTAAITVMGGIGGLFFLAGSAWKSYVIFIHWITEWLPAMAMEETNWTTVLARKGTFLFMDIWLPVASVTLLAAFTVTAAQAGLKISPTPLIPKFERFDPVKGIKKMFALRSLVEALKALVKAAFLFAILYYAIKNNFTIFQRVSNTDPSSGLTLIFSLFLKVSFQLGLALMLLGILDYGYQKWEFSRSIKMSKQEVKDEFKQSEGDPLVQQRIRSKQAEIGQKRMMSQVPDADVIVTNPTHFAIALKYDREKMAAPAVVAKGAGYVALRIREVASEAKVPIVEDKKIARTLYRNTDIGEPIPENLYVAVAEILAYVYSLSKDKSPRKSS